MENSTPAAARANPNNARPAAVFTSPSPCVRKSEPALGGHLRIESAERAGRRVAGVGVGFFAFGNELLVHPLEVFVVHVDFAAHFENGRRRVLRVFSISNGIAWMVFGVGGKCRRRYFLGPRVAASTSPANPRSAGLTEATVRSWGSRNVAGPIRPSSISPSHARHRRPATSSSL